MICLTLAGEISSKDSEDSDASLSSSDTADNLSRVICHLQKVPSMSDVLMSDTFFQRIICESIRTSSADSEQFVSNATLILTNPIDF